MGGRKRGDYTRNLGEFYRRFHGDDACLRYLIETRWPAGLRCPKCAGSDGRLLTTRRVWVCRSCRHHTSATAGAVLHRTRLPLTTWFAAADLAASLKPGVSALQLHALRRAMVDPDRSRLAGTVEVDEMGGKQAGLKGGRQRKNRDALMVTVAVERREKSLGRLRLEVVPDDSAATLGAFIARNIEPGSKVVSDAWPGYTGLAARDYTHLSLSQAAMKRAGLEGDAVPGVHRVVSNLKTWLLGTHDGVGADHLDHYLNEFVFRFNRRYLLPDGGIRHAARPRNVPVADDGGRDPRSALAPRDEATTRAIHWADDRPALDGRGDPAVVRIPRSGRSRASHYVWCPVEATG